MTSSDEAFRLLGAVNMPDYATRVTDVEVEAGLVKHAIDPDGLRLLLVPLAPEADEVEDHRSRAVTVETSDLIEGSASSRYVFVRCDDSSLVDLFSTVCDEILSGCAVLPSQPGAVVRGVLDRWRALLGPSRGTLLGESAVKGLLAELHVLERLAAGYPARALERWTGSDRTRHDFSGPTIACEVKASAMVDEVRVRIHGLSQLLEPSGGRLVLVVERLEPTPVGGDSIPDAIHRLTMLGVDENDLLSKLRDAGAHVADFKTYKKMRFKTLETRAYEVDSSFPRLVPSTLTGLPVEGRVHSVEYILDLAAPPPHVLSDAELDDAMYLLLADEAP